MQNENRYETMSDAELEQAAMGVKREKNVALARLEDERKVVSKLNNRLEEIMREIWDRNHNSMIQSFKLTQEHVILLKEIGADPENNNLTDLEISEKLEWSVSDDGLTVDQEKQIAKLLSELKYAQEWINERADGLVRLGESDAE